MSSYRILTYSGMDPALDSYKDMIYSDFMKTLKYGNEWYALIDRGSYFKAYERLIGLLFRQMECEVKLAVLSEDHDVCLGWSMYEGPRLHYVYVKKDMRKKGIGWDLFPKGIQSFTHLTTIGKSIWKNKLPGVIFNPFL